MENGNIEMNRQFCSFTQPRFNNGRVYDRESMVEALNVYRKKINTGSAFGEMRDSKDTDPFTSLNRISHIIKDVEVREDGVYGTIEILNTRFGREVKALIQRGYKPLVSPRCSGVDDRIKDIFSFDIIDFKVNDDDVEDSNFEEWNEE